MSCNSCSAKNESAIFNDMNTKILKNLFVDELQDMYDAEHRIVKALPKMAKAATCTRLQAALLKHLKETEGQITKLDQVFKSIGEKAKAKKCDATVGLLKEGDEIAAEYKGSAAINAALISAGQKVEHYEIASYGCLHEWAGMLGQDKAARLLLEILDQEKAANETLTELARSGSNQQACQGDEEEPANNPQSRISPKSRQVAIHLN
jgi:ferritin-like metal-binding protein YciE